MASSEVRLVTIKFDGVSHEIPVEDLDLNINENTDTDVRTAVSRHLGSDVSEYDVQRFDTVINLLPDAVHAVHG